MVVWACVVLAFVVWSLEKNILLPDIHLLLYVNDYQNLRRQDYSVVFNFWWKITTVGRMGSGHVGTVRSVTFVNPSERQSSQDLSDPIKVVVHFLNGILAPNLSRTAPGRGSCRVYRGGTNKIEVNQFKLSKTNCVVVRSNLSYCRVLCSKRLGGWLISFSIGSSYETWLHDPRYPWLSSRVVLIPSDTTCSWDKILFHDEGKATILACTYEASPLATLWVVLQGVISDSHLIDLATEFVGNRL